MLLAGASFAEIIVQGTQATLRWNPPAGAVSGYQVLVSRNGGGLVDGGTVATAQVTVAGRAGDVVQIAVRAYGYPNGAQAGVVWGPASQLSDPIRFASTALADVAPVFACSSCKSFEMRDLDGTVLASFAYPSDGDWEFVTLGSFAPGHAQALLRDRTTGALWIGDIAGNSLVHYASVASPNFAKCIARAADMDGDGTPEVVLYDPSSGRIEVWGFPDGMPERRLQWSGPIGWRLIGAGDFDGDRQPDLWFDGGGGVLMVARFRLFQWIDAAVFSVPVGNTTAVAVADYDGDWISDLLWRDASGVLMISYMTGDLNSPYASIVKFPSQTGDENIVPAASVDLDDDGGAEILLQNTQTGSSFVALPLDASQGRRVLLETGTPDWKLVGMD